MGDIVERLVNISRGDHERGCNGRSYTCSCGYDDANEKCAEEAAVEIQRLRAEVERLARENASLEYQLEDAQGHLARWTEAIETRAEAFERAAQIAENWEKTMQPGMLLDLAFREVAIGIRQAAQEVKP